MNRLQELTRQGQSVWLDFTRRGFVADGKLQRLIEEDGVTGVTSNPAIFDEAFGHGNDYDDAIRRAAARRLLPGQTYEEIVVEDIQAVADALRPIYDRTSGADGYASLEVSPHLAYETEASVSQGREFWKRVQRPNLMVKVPATLEGLSAIRQLVADGINVNVTLLFSLPRYRAVVEAYLTGLELRRKAGQPIDRVASVASFFLSRIDVVVDRKLEELEREGGDVAAQARRLRGQAAIASARQAYRIFREVFAGERFRALADRGARPQRLLWASTSTKRPEERDVRYVEALIGPETINTMPMKTLEAFRDHGDPTPRLAESLEESRAVLRGLGELGVSLEAASRHLEEEGVRKFIEPFDHAHDELERKLAAFAGEQSRR